MKNIYLWGALAVLLVGVFVVTRDSGPSLGLAVCTVTESKVGVGHQLATTVVPGGARSWAVIQQPLNATNTLSISVGGTAVAGSGYGLTPATSTSPTNELRLGFATDLPTGQAVTAITNTGSSTVNVVYCR